MLDFTAMIVLCDVSGSESMCCVYRESLSLNVTPLRLQLYSVCVCVLVYASMCCVYIKKV